MAMVEVRDHAIWIKHIHGDDALTKTLIDLPAGSLIELVVDGVKGHWRKMDDGADGRRTDGIRALGNAKTHWHGLQDQRGSLVELQAA